MCASSQWWSCGCSLQQLLVGPFETLGSRKLCSENLRFLVLWCVSKYHRYALPLSNHSPLIHAFIFFGRGKRKQSSCTLRIITQKCQRGHTKRGAAETGWKEVRLDPIHHWLQL